MYALAKPVFFRADPEVIHDRLMAGLAFASWHPGLLRLMRWSYHRPDPRLLVSCCGLDFPNPVGLAAGFDKNAQALPAWLALGFGFVEVGSVTALAQPGNPKPRLFRLVNDRAIINRMGFNNAGADALARQLERVYGFYGRPDEPVGINLGKSKLTPLEDAPADYLRSLQTLYNLGDYFVINVSSPNTPGLRELQDKDKLDQLLNTVTAFIQAQTKHKPLLLKISPDINLWQLDEILNLLDHYSVSGVIATNTTISRSNLKTDPGEAGGLSGEPLKAQSVQLLQAIRDRSALPVISVGGIATVQDALQRLVAGASLLQLYTSLVFEGPSLAMRLNQGILGVIEQRQLESVQSLSKKFSFTTNPRLLS